MSTLTGTGDYLKYHVCYGNRINSGVRIDQGTSPLRTT